MRKKQYWKSAFVGEFGRKPARSGSKPVGKGGAKPKHKSGAKKGSATQSSKGKSSAKR